MAVSKEKKQEQIGKLELLQDLILDDMIKAIRDGTASATDRATIIRLLKDNGWDLDPANMPTDLKSKLTAQVSPTADIAGDIPSRIAKTG